MKFVLFEGVDGTGKTTLAKLCADKTGSAYYANPPACMAGARMIFNGSAPMARYHYYMAGNYLAGVEISQLLETQDVFCDRYVFSTLAAHSVLLNRDLPLPGDLLMPDRVVYLVASFEVIEARLRERNNGEVKKLDFLRKVSQKFDEMFAHVPGLLKIDTSAQSIDAEVDMILQASSSKTYKQL